MNNKQLVLAYFNCYETANRETLVLLLDEDFEFGSPHDPQLGMEDYLQKCWPFHKKAPKYRIDTMLEDGNKILVIYSCTTDEGNNFENAEYFEIVNARIKKIKVFYGTLSQ